VAELVRKSLLVETSISALPTALAELPVKVVVVAVVVVTVNELAVKVEVEARFVVVKVVSPETH